MLVAEGITLYIECLGHTRRPTTVNRAKQILTVFEKQLGDRDLETLNARDISGYIAGLPHAARTRANHHVRLIALLRHHGIALRVSAPRFVEKVPETYTETELTKFFTGCEEIYQRALFKLLLATGLRMQEARTLEWSDISDSGLVIIRAKPRWDFVPKTHEERRVPVAPSVLSLLHQVRGLRPGTLVFPSRFGRVDKHMLRTCKRVAARAGLDETRWSLHGFRRTFCTTLLRSGLDVRTVMSLMGHSDIESTMRYWRPLQSEELRGKIGALFSA